MTVNTLGVSYAGGKSRGGAWLWPLVPIAISIFAISALVSYHLRASSITPRTVPQSVVIGVYEFLGWVPACMFFGLVFAWSSIWFVVGSVDQPVRKLLRVLGLTIALAVFGNLDASAPHTGALGAWLGAGLTSLLGSFLGHLLMAPVTFLALLFATDSFWMSYFERRVLDRTRAELQAAAVGAASDSGVEPGVPEEFKQLARTLPPEAAEVAADADADVDLDAYFDRLDRALPGQARAESAPSVDEAVEAQADLAPAREAEAVSVRLSYFERRRLREEENLQRDSDATASAGAGFGETESLDGAEDLQFEGLGEEIPKAPVEDAEDEVASRTESMESIQVAASAADEVVAAANEAKGDEATEVAVESVDSINADAETHSGATYEVRFQPLFDSPLVHATRDNQSADDEDEGSESVERDGQFVGEGENLNASPDETVRASEPAIGDASAATAAWEAPVAEEMAASERGSQDAAADASPAETGAEVEACEKEATEQPGIEAASVVTIDFTVAVDVDVASVDSEDLVPDQLQDAVELASNDADPAANPVPEASDESTDEAVQAHAASPACGPNPEDEFEAEAAAEAADLSFQRPRGFLAPLREDPVNAAEEAQELAPLPEPVSPAASLEPAAAAAEDNRDADEAAAPEPVVSIPRPTDSRRQMSLFGGGVDEALLREAREICESAGRASVVLLQRRLRIDYEQARVVLAQLAEQGVLSLQADGTQGRVLD